MQVMASAIDIHETVLNTWKTTNRTTIFLIDHVPAELWNEKIPGSPRRTVGMIACHIHNIRCRWIKAIGKDLIAQAPARVDQHRARRAEVIRALHRSSHAMLQLLSASLSNGGKLPGTPAWLNFPNDVVHFLAYFVAHEGHHRGQIILLARQLDHRLPASVTNGVWQWNKRLKETR